MDHDERIALAGHIADRKDQIGERRKPKTVGRAQAFDAPESQIGKFGVGIEDDVTLAACRIEPLEPARLESALAQAIDPVTGRDAAEQQVLRAV
ncbi:hypothetical protein D9M73_106520 [compost metagenome]